MPYSINNCTRYKRKKDDRQKGIAMKDKRRRPMFHYLFDLTPTRLKPLVADQICKNAKIIDITELLLFLKISMYYPILISHRHVACDNFIRIFWRLGWRDLGLFVKGVLCPSNINWEIIACNLD
jgi:hypothetical protein